MKARSVFLPKIRKPRSITTIQELGPAGETYNADAIKGWIGITDKYWLTAFVPEQQDNLGFGFAALSGGGEPAQVDTGNTPLTLADGESLKRVFHLYAGPKKVNVLLDYNERLGVERLDHAIDWGWFLFLTKPFFHGLNWFYGLLGNFGLAILALTVVVKLAFFPLANKSIIRWPRCRELAPAFRNCGTVSPMTSSGCNGNDAALPGRKDQPGGRLSADPATQIPVFFALYKVLFVTIEMRHAAFYGWINDLSALDPTSVLNLFGLLPYATAWARFPQSRHLADPHGDHHVCPDVAEPAAARPGSGQGLQVHATAVHVPAGHLPGRARDLLDLEQPAFDHPADVHHAVGEEGLRQKGVTP